MSAIGKLFRKGDETSEPIMVHYDLDIPPAGTLERLDGVIGAEDANFARENLFEEFVLVTEGGRKIYLAIKDESGNFVGRLMP
jgi:hypothetical protein